MSPENNEAKQRAIALENELHTLYRQRAQKEESRNNVYARVFPAVKELLYKEFGPDKQLPQEAELAAVDESFGELVAQDVDLAELNDIIKAKQAERDSAIKTVISL